MGSSSSDDVGQQAMTAERLAEIERRVEQWQRGYWLAGEKAASLIQNGDERHEIAIISAEYPATIDLLTNAYADEAALLAEVERLRASAETAAGEQAAQVDSAPHCDYCSQPWTVQAWRVNMDVREWLCATHFDDLSSDRLYRIERDRRSEQEEVLYSDEEAEAAYHSYEDDLFDEPHGDECCCEDCLQDYPERDALYNDSQFYGVPSDGTVAMLCSYPGCEVIAEIIEEGEPIPAGSIGRKHMFCPKHEQAAQGEA